MKHEQAIRILMESPLYFTLAPPERKKLIDEYCTSYSKAESEIKKRNRRK